MAEEIPRTLQASKRLSSDLENQDSAEQNKRGKGPLLLPDSSLWICRNPACRATQTTAPRFCKRCSCCICGRFDNYTDPSLWLKCTPYSGPEFSCGFSCHIECALRHGRVGARTLHVQLDGCYSCPSCSKVSSIIGCWKKQLKMALIAVGTNCIDVLCYRIFLSYRLLKGTTRFSELHKFVEDLKAAVEMELGPINEATSKMARAHSVRLCAANHVQALCKFAIKKAEELLPPNPAKALNVNVAEGSGSGSVLKTTADKLDRFKSIRSGPRETLDREKGSNSGAGTEKCIVQPDTLQQEGLPGLNVGFQEPNAKPNAELLVKRSGSGGLDDAFESIVRTICGLQHNGHVSKEFRLKFLTWFSLKATEHEHRVVRTFVKTMIEDPCGLAAQLVDTFSDIIFSSRS